MDLKQDGFDCGDELSELLCDFLGEKDHRLIFNKQGEHLYTERTCAPTDEWWDKNPVPKRRDDVSQRPKLVTLRSLRFHFF